MDEDVSLYDDHTSHHGEKHQLAEEMETDVMEEGDSSTSQLAKNIKDAMTSVNTDLVERLTSCALEGSNVSNLRKMIDELVENAIDGQCGKMSPNLWPEFTHQIKSKFQQELPPDLSHVVRIVGIFKAKLEAKLDSHECLKPETFHGFSDELLTKVLEKANDTAARKLVTLVCSKLTKTYEARNEWIVENKTGIESKMEDIVANYETEIRQKITGNKTLKSQRLSFHADLKNKYADIFQREFDGSVDLLSYKVRLYGLLNQKYGQIVREMIVEKKAKLQIESVSRSNVQGAHFVSEAAKKPKNPIDDASRLRTKRKEQHFYNVRQPEDDEKPTRLGDTKIFIYDSKELSTRGSSATVYEGLFGEFGGDMVPAAIKKFHRQDIKLYENELKIWKQVAKEKNKDSVNVVQLLDHQKWSTSLYLAIELAEMDLGQKIIRLKTDSLSSEDLFQKLVGYVKEASKGLQWLHTKKIIHRDIKPQNILIFCYSIDDKIKEIAKLTDFGISRITDPVGCAKTRADGTDDWAAPEVLKAKKNLGPFTNKKAQDIFSLGLTAHFTLSLGKHPFGDDSMKHGQAWNISDESVIPSRLPNSEYTANNLIQSMIDRNPAHRPKISDVLKHPLFWDVEKSLNFLVEFAFKFYGSKDPAIKEFRANIDEAYVEELKDKEKFDWKVILGEEKLEGFMQRKTNTWNKAYSGDSLMSLLELIRDKYAHLRDMCDTLLTDNHFGEDGAFSKKKYAQYFLQTFPDVLMFLVNIVHSQADENPDLKQLLVTYFKGA